MLRLHRSLWPDETSANWKTAKVKVMHRPRCDQYWLSCHRVSTDCHETNVLYSFPHQSDAHALKHMHKKTLSSAWLSHFKPRLWMSPHLSLTPSLMRLSSSHRTSYGPRSKKSHKYGLFLWHHHRRQKEKNRMSKDSDQKQNREQQRNWCH